MSNKLYYSHDDIHQIVENTARDIADKFNPDYIIGIGCGGFIPARILRGYLNVPMVAVTVELYDNDNTTKPVITKHQWLGSKVTKELTGKKILIVDEVDDTRSTLAFCVEEVRKTCATNDIAVFVVHNKNKKKLHDFSDKKMPYFVGEEIEDKWIVYPWESQDINEHNKQVATQKLIKSATIEAGKNNPDKASTIKGSHDSVRLNVST